MIVDNFEGEIQHNVGCGIVKTGITKLLIYVMVHA